MSNRESVPARSGQWQVTARGGIVLRTDWEAVDLGWRVRLRVEQLAGPGMPREQSAVLGLRTGDARETTMAFGAPEAPVDITFSLRMPATGSRVMLWANVPLTPSEFFNGAIADWLIAGGSDPIDPDDGRVIERLPGSTDLFPFVWMPPLDAFEVEDIAQRTMRAAEPLPALYAQVAAAAGIAARQAQATAFRAGPDFIASLADEPAPIPTLPAARLELLATEGDQDPDALVAQATRLLGGETPAEFLASAAAITAQANAWPSLLTLALVGTSADRALCASLVDMLRVCHYLAALAADADALVEAATRRRFLCATPVFPDDTVAAPLAGAVTTPAAAAGEWQLLGVGELERARQALLGYAQGELAEVVGVLPRERLERHDRSVVAAGRESASADERRSDAERARQSDAASELADTLQESMFSDGLMRNLSQVKPSYENLNLTLSGAAAEAAAKLHWDGGRVARVVQRMSERAAQTVADRVSSQRRDVHREWHERRASQCIDNHDGARLVGVYRWIDRLVRIRLVPEGRRLVLALQLTAPAASWRAAVAAQGPVPLQEPQPLAAFAVANGQGYALVTPTDYQSWGAQYAITDLPPPPPDALVVHAQIDRVTVADASLLQVPAGYHVGGGNATLALADASRTVVATVGATVVAPPPAIAAAPLKVSVPAVSTPTSVGDPTLDPPAPLAAQVTQTFFATGDKILGATGGIPVTVMTDAPLFGLGITLDCARSTLVDPTTKAVVDPLLVDWQMQVYQRLLRGWEEAMLRYDAALQQRIVHASRGRTDEIQRQALQQSCLALLTASSACADAAVLRALLDWSAMSWHYETPPVIAPVPVDPGAAVVTEPASARLFRRFLEAESAWVLLPVKPEHQDELLFALQWQPRWPDAARGASVPLSASTAVLVEAQRGDPALPAPLGREWTLRLPLPLIYLQDGDALPSFEPPVVPDVPVDPAREAA